MRERTLAAIGFGVLAMIVTWPLAAHLSTALPGDPTGDTGVYLWNQWIFRHELLQHAQWPFVTNHIFALTNGTELSVHNYTVFADLLALPLIGRVGLVAAFNLVDMFLIALSGYSAFLLCRRLISSGGIAWISGAVFMTSPFLIARGTAHYSLVAAAPLPLFILCVSRALASRRTRDAMLAGAVMGWAGYCDAYYTIHCVLMGTVMLAHHQWSVRTVAVESPRRLALRVNEALLLAGVTVIGFRLWHGEFTAVWLNHPVSLRTLYTPVLCVGALGVTRLQFARRLQFAPRPAAIRFTTLLKGIAVAGVAAGVMLAPIVVGLGRRVFAGRMPSPEINWRSSPPGMDVVDLLVPNPNNPWFGGVPMHWIMSRGPLAYPEFVGSLSLVALVVIALTWWRVRDAIPRFWIAFTAVFASLALGPFVNVASINTFVPGPWALLRYVPIIGLARSPTRFAVVAALGVSVLLAYALTAVRAKVTTHWRFVAPVIGVALAFELLPAPRQLFDASVPAVYSTIRGSADESLRLLELPSGVRDGTSSIGDFNASAQYYQTIHRKPLVGGYQSRVSEWRKRAEMQVPVLAALFTLSQRTELTPQLAQRARASREVFVDQACIGYVVIDRRRASPALRALAIDLLDLVKIGDDPSRELFVPAHTPVARPCRPKP